MDDAVLALPEMQRAQHPPLTPPVPLFEGITSRKLRVLFAVLMGSDACLGGVPDLGIAREATDFTTTVM